MNPLKKLLASALLLAVLACTGGKDAGPPPPATRLTYADPTDASQWRLARNAGSSSTHLILDLLGPSGGAGRGVSAVFTCDSKLAWKAVDGAAFLKLGGAYNGDLVQRASVQGADLRVLLSQKPGTAQAYGSSPVLSVAVDLVAGTLPGAVTLTTAQGAHLGASATPEPISIAVGTLKAE
jgi:hypothetical protein